MPRRRRGGRAPAPCSPFLLLLSLLCAAFSLTSALKPEDWKVRRRYLFGREESEKKKKPFPRPSIDRAPPLSMRDSSFEAGPSLHSILPSRFPPNGEDRTNEDPSKEKKKAQRIVSNGDTSPKEKKETKLLSTQFPSHHQNSSPPSKTEMRRRALLRQAPGPSWPGARPRRLDDRGERLEADR